jgi:hypothetical protein
LRDRYFEIDQCFQKIKHSRHRRQILPDLPDWERWWIARSSLAGENLRLLSICFGGGACDD